MFALVSCLVGLLYLAIGNVLPKLGQHNTLFAKVETEESMEQERKLTRKMGYAFVIGGLLLLLNSIFPEAWRAFSFTSILVGLALAKAWLSLRHMLRHAS